MSVPRLAPAHHLGAAMMDRTVHVVTKLRGHIVYRAPEGHWLDRHALTDEQVRRVLDLPANQP